MPQLATRYALARLPAIATGVPHIDLLHPARRLFARMLDSCRLSEIESALLGLRRQGDVPSWMIPGLYFAYIRRRDLGGLHPVFEHNHLDVVSLVALLAYLDRVAGGDVSDEHALPVATWDQARGRLSDAAALYERTWQMDPHGEDGGIAVRRLARIRRRSEGWERARALWEQEVAVTSGAVRHIRARIELAKIAEHRLRQPALALDHARAATEVLASHRGAPLSQTSDALRRRIARLEGRMTRGAGVGRGGAGRRAPRMVELSVDFRAGVAQW